MSLFFQELWSEWPSLLSGIKWTIILSACITVSGLLGGMFLLYLQTQSKRWIRLCASAFISFFIGTPLIALLFLMYYGLPAIGWDLSPFTTSFIGFTLNVSAYNARYLSSGYNAIDSHELTAAKAMGYTNRQMYLFLILPQSLRYAVPGLVSQCINNLKDSSVAFLIQFEGFLSFIQNFTAQNFCFSSGYLFAAAVYLLLVTILTLLARAIHHRLRVPGFV